MSTHASSGRGNTGVLTGDIDLCSGVGYSMLPPNNRPPKLFSAAATVVLLRGRIRRKPTTPGTWRLIFPSTVVARQRVGRNQPYRFADLPPGHYVVRAWYAGSVNTSTFRPVTLPAGTVVHATLPNLCK